MGVSHFSGIDIKDSLNVSIVESDGDLELLVPNANVIKGNGHFRISEGKDLQLGSPQTFLRRGTDETIFSSDVKLSFSVPLLYVVIDGTSGGDIDGYRAVKIVDGNFVQASANERNVVGFNLSDSQKQSGESIKVGISGVMYAVADSKVESGSYVKVAADGRVVCFADSGKVVFSQADVGGGFTNQPQNDAVEILSSDASDTTQKLTIYGTIYGEDSVVSEVVTLNGTNVVSTVRTNWGYILGVELDNATVGDVTIREASGDLTITTISAGSLSKGVISVSGDVRLYNVAPVVKSDGATTKVVGVIGKDVNYSDIIESVTLDGDNEVEFESAFNSVSKILVGDLETDRSIYLLVGEDEPARILGKAITSANNKDEILKVLV